MIPITAKYKIMPAAEEVDTELNLLHDGKI
jgi:hypothetical protein